jgi:hypothetical protein
MQANVTLAKYRKNSGVRDLAPTAVKDSSRGLLGYDAMQFCGRIPTFRRSMLPESSGGSDSDAVQRCYRIPWFRRSTTLHGVTTHKNST